MASDHFERECLAEWSAAPPPRRRPLLPDPSGPSENGKVPCNEPLLIDGQAVAFCGRSIKWRRRGRERATHRGPHRFEWWS